MTLDEFLSALPDGVRFGRSLVQMGHVDVEHMAQAVGRCLKSIIAPDDEIRYGLQVGPGFGRVANSDLLTGKIDWLLVLAAGLVELTAEMTRDEGPLALRLTTHRIPLADVLRHGIEHTTVHADPVHSAVVLGGLSQGPKERQRRISSKEVVSVGDDHGLDALAGFVLALVGVSAPREAT
jgi:hypothetical protein